MLYSLIGIRKSKDKYLEKIPNTHDKVGVVNRRLSKIMVLLLAASVFMISIYGVTLYAAFGRALFSCREVDSISTREQGLRFAEEYWRSDSPAVKNNIVGDPMPQSTSVSRYFDLRVLQDVWRAYLVFPTRNSEHAEVVLVFTTCGVILDQTSIYTP